MKLREFFYLLGLKPAPRTYGFTVEEHPLPREGTLRVARWLHPGVTFAPPPQQMVDEWRRWLKPGDVAVDIGAHTGDTALPMALAAGPTGLVIALEPNPYVFPVLEKNASLNPDKARIVPLNFAAMREAGTFQFQYGEPGFGNGGYHEGQSKWLHGSAFTVDVAGRNLAEYLERHHAAELPRLKLIKVDAEGFDLAVLETLDALIARLRPYILVEFFNIRKIDPSLRRGLYDFLAVKHRYAVHHADEQGRLDGERVTPDNLMTWNHFDAFCVP